MVPWSKVSKTIGGKEFTIIAVPCQHLPGGECIGFLLECSDFGTTDGRPNAIYFIGDTVFTEELLKIADTHHVSIMLINLGDGRVPLPDGTTLQLTMDAKSAAKLIAALKPDVVVPQHFDSWAHFSEASETVRKIWVDMGITNVNWGRLGEAVDIF